MFRSMPPTMHNSPFLSQQQAHHMMPMGTIIDHPSPSAGAGDDTTLGLANNAPFWSAASSSCGGGVMLFGQPSTSSSSQHYQSMPPSSSSSFTNNSNNNINSRQCHLRRREMLSVIEEDENDASCLLLNVTQLKKQTAVHCLASLANAASAADTSPLSYITSSAGESTSDSYSATAFAISRIQSTDRMETEDLYAPSSSLPSLSCSTHLYLKTMSITGLSGLTTSSCGESSVAATAASEEDGEEPEDDDDDWGYFYADSFTFGSGGSSSNDNLSCSSFGHQHHQHPLYKQRTFSKRRRRRQAVKYPRGGSIGANRSSSLVSATPKVGYP